MIERTATGIRLRVRVQPRASCTELAGRRGDALRVRIAAPPVEGAANEALLRFLADELRVPRGAIALAAGAAGRNKIVTVAGIGVAAAARCLGL